MRALLALALVATAAVAQNPQDFIPFLLANHLPSGMPRSYAVEPTNYFEKVPTHERPHHYNTSHYIPQCNNMSVPAANMNAYMFQTEELLTGIGLDIYDASIWCIALSIMNHSETCLDKFINGVLVPHKTVQFADIRGDAPCKGRMFTGACTDPHASGVCGFCYGDDDASLTNNDAYFFRMISDYWAIEGTIDARCPSLNKEWIWNDYKPILGENAWANMIGPAQVAMVRAGYDANAVPDTDPMFVLGIPFLKALATMKVGDTGAFYYTPWNTWFGFSHLSETVGSTYSIENQASTLAGLRSLYYVINAKKTTQYKSYLPTIKTYAQGVQKSILNAWNHSAGYFRQGGHFNQTSGKQSWGQIGEPLFAVDCQTWVGSVLGTKVIDSNFGHGAAYNLWQTTKKAAGYSCPNGGLCGVGYTYNNISGEVFSGEWTYGAINWLRIMVNDSGYKSEWISNLQSDISAMEFGLETYLYTSTKINNSTDDMKSVKYANKRYWIPFGWYANSIPATASTAWAVTNGAKYNPFNVNHGAFAPYDGW